MSRRTWKVAAACVMALSLTACGVERPGAQAEWVSSAAPGTSPTPTAPATSAPARLKTIDSACALLPADVVVDVLGGTAASKLTAKEDPVERLEEGRIRHGCTYRKGQQEPFSLIVSTRPDRAADAAAAIEAIGKASGAKTTPVDGLGAGGVGYATSEGIRVVAVAVTYEDELRLVIFSGPTVVPHAKLVEVAEHVVVQV
ncbi:DUF3558 domain-containing protein [Phytohabitans aurantiacus]|uniref:DUF3558 domain-containing protein n=1 Tax=Phytohabitans aurantiacus TaxID=3016789 RepID=A0ABQ5R5H1_9ACTN|nr:hypothetical protein [Phytohabitans aurantiacus]GLI01781.1 hypothetical protein Pa4123_70570 [Phytohabitans aurantiacus]